MSSVILTNWTVFYADDAGSDNTGYKQIRWTGGGGPETNTNTVNELYSALADLFSISDQNNANATIPMRAITPTVYQIGGFDAGDLEPWFIDPESVKHLTRGSLETSNWTRIEGATANDGNSGIVKVAYTVSTTQFVNNDIGRTVNHNAGSTGTLLWFDTSTNEAWIRPTDSTSTHNWTMGGTNVITVTGGTGSVTQSAAPVSDERLWANIFTIGTIEDNTQMYVYQDFTKITNFWSPGHIDRLFLVDDGFDAGLIDFGLLTVYARQYSKFYDHFVSDVSGGGRNAVPIATIADTNNTSGYYQTVFSSSTGTWAAGQTFTKNGDSTREGTVTSATGSNPDTIQYYLSGASLTPFSDTDEVTSSGGGPATGFVQTPTNVGPANLAAITITFGAGTDEDIGQGGPQPYDVHIDVGGNTLADFYEYTKYITRRGNTDDIDGGGQTITGESYITPGEVRLSYEGQTVNYLEGATLTGQTSGATGIITAVHDSGATGTVIVRDVRGTFQAGESILDDQGTPGNGTILASDGIANTTIIKGSPFGTLAGVSFFGARGVWIESMAGADANNYSLIDSNGVTREPPATVPITVNGLVSGDRVSVFRATGAGEGPNKSYLLSHATNNSILDTSWETDVSTPIPLDTPASGTLRIVDVNTNPTLNQEYRVRFSSYSTSTNIFTLASNDVTAGVGTDENTINATGEFTGALAKVGDIIVNTSRSNAVSYITSITSDDEVEISPAITNQQSGDAIKVNVLPITNTGIDTAYVPYIDTQATGATASASVQYATDRFIVTRVRITGIVPYSITGTLDSTGYSATAIRNPDNIAQ